MKPRSDKHLLLTRYRIVMGFFIAALVVSGLTAFPLLHELELAVQIRSANAGATGFDKWLVIVRDGLRDAYGRHPWIAYGTDWLAFAHLIIAIFFLGAWRNPVRNVWIVKAGLIACALILPLALVAGAVREIPLGWRLIDCSFGVFGAIPLAYCLHLTGKLERLSE